jgi:hypothetical protein
MTAGAAASDASTNASGITGYNYRLPKIGKGAILLSN